MKHATDAALDKLSGLLSEVRTLAPLHEKKRGVFYLKSKAFLHFHEDPKGWFADLRSASEWRRLPVSTRAQQDALIARIRSKLARQSGR